MSNSSQVGAVGGALIGGLLAAPTGGVSLLMGGSLGLSIGATVGAYVHPPLVGPRLSDAQKQTSTVGGVIPFGYGRFVTAGNVIWSDALKEHHKRSGGKGSGATRQRTLTRSYAIGVCEGPIRGFVWIKRNGKTVYGNAEPRPSDEVLAAYSRFADKCSIYTGTEDQMPDASIVAVEGVGNVSAFRGLAYLVVAHDDLTEVLGAIPQYEFCVDATLPDVYLSSRPYAHDIAVEGIATTPGMGAGQLKDNLLRPPTEAIQMQASLASGSLSQGLHTDQPPAEGVVLSSASAIAGELRSQLHAAKLPGEGIQMPPPGLTAGLLKHLLATTDIPTEATQMQPAKLMNGSLV